MNATAITAINNRTGTERPANVEACIGRTFRIPCSPIMRNLSDDGRTIEATVVAASGSWNSIRGIELDARTERGHNITISYRPNGGHPVTWL